MYEQNHTWIHCELSYGAMEVEIALEAPKRKWKVRNCQENPSERSLGSSVQASIFERSRLTSVRIGQRCGEQVYTYTNSSVQMF